jgi:hypothetical protein
MYLIILSDCIAICMCVWVCVCVSFFISSSDFCRFFTFGIFIHEALNFSLAFYYKNFLWGESGWILYQTRRARIPFLVTPFRPVLVGRLGSFWRLWKPPGESGIGRRALGCDNFIIARLSTSNVIDQLITNQSSIKYTARLVKFNYKNRPRRGVFFENDPARPGACCV